MAAPYRHSIQPEADADFPAEIGRYHLYVTYTCPFACRALAARDLKGLQDAISISVAHPIYQKTKPSDDSDDHKGWTFVDPATEHTFLAANGNTYSTDGCIPDTVNHTRFVRDLYELVDKEPRRYTVPLLWDKKKQTIVSSESADILRTLNIGFRDLVPSTIDLLPPALEDAIDAANAGIVESISSGVFKTALAKSEGERVPALADFFEYIQSADDILSKSRYLVGNTITEADVRAFHSLIRFDIFQRDGDAFALSQYPNVVNYLRDLYQTPGLKSTVNWQHLKLMFINYNEAIVGHDPTIDYDAAHDRAVHFAS